jgi:hypothetical protein
VITSPQRFHHGVIDCLVGLAVLFAIRAVVADVIGDGLEEIPDGVRWQQAGKVEVNAGGDPRMVSAVPTGRDCKLADLYLIVKNRIASDYPWYTSNKL